MTDDYATPDGTMTPADLAARIRPHDLESGRAWARGDFQGALENLQTGVRDGFLAGFADALRGIVRAPLFQGVADAFEDGQADLNARTDLLSPLLDYGSCYMEAVGGWEPTGVLPFNQQLGPMRGCEMHQNGIRLLDRGLWDIRAQITASWVRLVTSDVEWRVRVMRPEGSVYSEQRSIISLQDSTTPAPIISSVVVPDPGFYVQVELLRVGAGRDLLGGPAWSRLVVQHISRETGAGGTGAEPSDTMPDEDESGQ